MCQVDRKFIACIAKLELARNTLILIDQHAADERIRVERFLKDMSSQFLDDSPATFGVRRASLPEPLRILLPTADIQRLRDNPNLCRLIARWGFEISLPHVADRKGWQEDRSREENEQITVATVPDILFARVSGRAD